MKSKKPLLSWMILAAMLGAWCVRLHAQKDEGASKAAASKETGEKTFPWDNGPDTLDVSKYPPERQADYKVFVRKCSKCHTLARAINSPYALPEEWGAYVKKMQKKKRSGLDAKSAEKIVAFLEYDSSVRKKDLIEKKLKEKKADK